MSEPFLWGSQIDLPAGVYQSHMTALRNGTFLVIGKAGTTWESVQLKAWIYNADGSLKEEKILVSPDLHPWYNNFLGRAAINPVAAELPDGRIGITWSVQASTDRAPRNAWLGLYDADLEPLGPPQSIAGYEPREPYAIGSYRSDDVIDLSEGRLLVTYLDYDGRAFFRIRGSDGVLSDAVPLGSTAYATSFPAEAGQFTSVTDLATLSNGKVVVMLRVDEMTIRGYILDPSAAGGPTLSEPFSIPVMAELPLKSLEVTALEGGGFVVTWIEKGKSGESTQEPDPIVKFQIFDAAGAEVAEPMSFYASTAEIDSLGAPNILALPGGGFALAAQVVPNMALRNSEVRLAIFTAEGERVSDRLLVSKPAAEGLFSLIGLSLLADGRIAVHLSNGIQIVDPRDKAISLIGTARNDHYIGTAFDDTFDGGAGADRLEGAGGNDTYVVDNAGDQVIEKANEGIDTVRTSISYGLIAHVEHLTATGSASIALMGNTLANAITGNAGANRIDGGAGADTLRGGLGDDTLDGGAGADLLDGGAGFDFVSFASSSVGVRAGPAVGSGDGDTWTSVEGIIGSAHADTLIGNGASQLHGSGGNDIYEVRMGDLVAESAGGGRDTVLAAGSYTLSASAEIEVLKLSGIPSKTSANLTGSDTANEILGHEGTNTLRGLSGNDVLKASAGNDTLKGDAGSDKLYGGLGNDKLYGGTGSGKDVFVFDTKLSKTKNVDRIYDFNAKYDSFHLENKIFTKLGKDSSKGVKFKSDMFVKGKAAQDREDRIIYDKDTGALYYDRDGTGSAAQVKIATLNKNLKIDFGDFYVI